MVVSFCDEFDTSLSGLFQNVGHKNTFVVVVVVVDWYILTYKYCYNTQTFLWPCIGSAKKLYLEVARAVCLRAGCPYCYPSSSAKHAQRHFQSYSCAQFLFNLSPFSGFTPG